MDVYKVCGWFKDIGVEWFFMSVLFYTLTLHDKAIRPTTVRKESFPHVQETSFPCGWDLFICRHVFILFDNPFILNYRPHTITHSFDIN